MFGSVTASSAFFEGCSEFDTDSRNSNSCTTGSNTSVYFPQAAQSQSIHSHNTLSADWTAVGDLNAASWHSAEDKNQNYASDNNNLITSNPDSHTVNNFGSLDFNCQHNRIQHEQRQLELEILLLRKRERERERDRYRALIMQFRQEQISQHKFQPQQRQYQQYSSSSLDQDLLGVSSPGSAMSRQMSIDASTEIPSPTNSFYSNPNNSIDMERSVFTVGRLYTESPPQQQATIEVTRSGVNFQSLQTTGGGIAAITPNFAIALTVAQCALSQRKKQKDSIPPVGYCCRLCAIEGHWMENCILCISNKHPQYNNAARTVALNIISPNSQVILNSLPVVQQPQYQYTPKFCAEQMKQHLEQEYYLQQQQQKYSHSDTPNSLSSLLPDNVSRFSQIWN